MEVLLVCYNPMRLKPRLINPIAIDCKNLSYDGSQLEFTIVEIYLVASASSKLTFTTLI